LTNRCAPASARASLVNADESHSLDKVWIAGCASAQRGRKNVPKDNEVLIWIHATTVFAGDCEIRDLKAPVALRLPIWIYMSSFRPGPIILVKELGPSLG
jgi:hypothetical protein